MEAYPQRNVHSDLLEPFCSIWRGGEACRLEWDASGREIPATD